MSSEPAVLAEHGYKGLATLLRLLKGFSLLLAALLLLVVLAQCLLLTLQQTPVSIYLIMRSIGGLAASLLFYAAVHGIEALIRIEINTRKN
ncbi:hypothetical protein [Gallaecimonas mangrovi]|uniref:hypothetical protein n=1 Tax=Gallaecimonas mangrovi TaxID=2291597 RepID=UPI000E1FDCB8|nr:hypothetical protein [Gallaecimonas mangrovi]